MGSTLSVCHEDKACFQTVPSERFSASPGTKMKERGPSSFDSVDCAKMVGTDATFLAWSLYDGASLLQEQRLLSLHHEISSCAEIVGAYIVESAATQGLLLCSESLLAKHESRGSMTPEDSMVRMGQLLCRWAISQEPPMQLRVGAHSGPVSTLKLPVGGQAFFGEAVFEAKRLAETSPQDCCVHILRSTRDRLNVLERLPFTCSRANDSYYLEPSAQVPEEVDGPLGIEAEGNADCSCTPEFRNTLLEHGMDLSRFGKGQAKTLDEFYRNVAVEKKSYLVATLNGLERRMDTVAISLRAAGKSGDERELRLANEIRKDGALVRRNQRPVLSVEEGKDWMSAVDTFLGKRMGLSQEIREELLKQKDNRYSCKVETSHSQYFAGIKTLYTTHELSIKLHASVSKDLQIIGLPSMINFETAAAPPANLNKATWSWRPVGEELSNEEALAQLLQEHGVDAHDYPPETLADFCDELYESRYATLNMRDGQLVRNIQIIKVWLCATILSVEYVLTSKGKVQNGKRERNHKEGPATMRMLSDQDWRTAVVSCLWGKLGMDEAFIKSNLVIVDSSYRLDEEVEYSRSYPGLKTVYNVHTVRCRVKDVQRPEMAFIGLPDGNDFSFVRMARSTRRPSGSQSNNLVSTHWCWKPRNQLSDVGDILYLRKSITDRHPDVDLLPAAKRQLDPPQTLRMDDLTLDPKQGLVVGQMLKGRSTNWDVARRCAKRIADPSYSLKNYYDDCVSAFPELLLYTVDGGSTSTSSGRTVAEEYQRTVGALFAFFWFMRRRNGGAQSFCFGVDDDWNPLSFQSKKPRRSEEELQKRKTFLEEVTWDKIEDLLQDAGLFLPNGSPDEERTLAMLVLTAIHDIMKMVVLLPKVAQEHKIFRGYKVDEVISDHDLALGYVLEFYPEVLPSFAGLPKASQDSIRFTQNKMDYNMGWLVQAEAPPGALFTKFKECVIAGSADPKDVAFYFCHWLTDLAGAEPYPQEGCEKFVLKFPRRVLSSFLNSFAIVRQLAVRSETQVYEDYLVWRWRTHKPDLGQVPEGPGSIAMLRLVVMAQGDSSCILSAFQQLPQEDREILTTEMACSGCQDQKFLREGQPPILQTSGPAILIYYAPALMQKAGATNPRAALRILAEIFRQSRLLWPFVRKKANESVTVRIDVLKELEVSGISQLTAGEIWALERSGRDAEVKKLTLDAESFSEGLQRGDLRVLNFASAPRSSVLSQESITASSHLPPSFGRALTDRG